MRPDLEYAIQTSIVGTQEAIDYLLSIFKCHNCGRCERLCTEGVYLHPQEIKGLASHLKVTKGNFIKNYCEVKDDTVLMKVPCVFHKNNRCLVYSIRPKVCRFFPLATNSESHNIFIYCCPGGIDLMKRLDINPDSPIAGGA